MKKLISLLLGVSLLLVLTAVAQAQKNNPGKKTFVFGDTTFNSENNEPDINPHNDNSGWACLRYGVGETLFRYSESMGIEPWLAQSYELIDELTWKIILRENMYFTSGRHLDAQAVKECLEALVKTHLRAAGDLRIAGMSADGQALTIVTTTPVPALPNYLSDPYGCIIDVQAGVTSQGIVSGTGPYMALSLAPGERLELVKNEKYWNGQPKIDEITVLTISDGDTLTMALQSGEIDAAYGLPYASYPLFRNDKYTFSSTATSRAFFLWMNFKSEVTQDPAVRKAIALGIDKNNFVAVLLAGNGYPASGVFPSSFSFGNEAVTTETYDPEKAKRILESAGWVDTNGDGIREKDGRNLVVRWLTYPSRQELPVLAESAQATLNEIGIAVEINNTADHNRIKNDAAAWDVYASAMITAPTGDPEYFFNYCALDSSSTNNGHYHSDKLENLARKLSGSFDQKERERLAVEMQQTILDDNAYVFCSHLRMGLVAKAKVIGLVAHPSDFYEITVDLDIN